MTAASPWSRGGRAAASPAPPAPAREPFAPDGADLLLAAGIALGLPFFAAWLLERTGGALASLMLYYLGCCIGVVRWRRGRLDYHWPSVWPWAVFLPALLLPVASAVINTGALPNPGAPVPAVLVTLLVWGGVNGACEQLVWFYVLDAWRCRWQTGGWRWLGLTAGVLLMLILVALIHILFWARFLPVGEATPLSRFSLPLNIALTGAYYWLYRRSGSMWPVAALHFLVDAQLVWIAQYSIGPDLKSVSGCSHAL